MHPQVQAYISRINGNDATLTEILLECLELTGADIAPLIAALADNANVAQRISMLNLRGNQLTEINIPATLVKLTVLHINSNELTEINIPKELTSLQVLSLDNNKINTINIPKELVALKHLALHVNQLTEINIPATLVKLTVLHINLNELTEINIPTTLTALRELGLYSNNLTAINIPEQLVALTRLNLRCNPLTDATKIALNAVTALRGGNLEIIHKNALPNDAILTPEILNAHFKPMLQVSHHGAINYLKKIGAIKLLSRLPAELVRMLADMVPALEIARAQTSMAYFQSIFSKLDDGGAQLTALNAYGNRYNVVVEATKDYYGGVLSSCKCIASKRKAREAAEDRYRSDYTPNAVRTYLPTFSARNVLAFTAAAGLTAVASFLSQDEVGVCKLKLNTL